MSQRAPGCVATTSHVAAAVGFLLLTCKGAQAASQAPSSTDLLALLALVVVAPLLPALAGAGLYVLTRSHLIAAGLCALGFGAFGAWDFARTSLDGPLSGALFGLATDGVFGGLMALAGSGYAHLIRTETRLLGGRKTATAQGVGLAFSALAFGLLLVTKGSDKVALGLYLAMLALSLGVSAATGSFGGVVVTMTLALLAMLQGLWGSALLNGARDAGQAYIAIIYVPPALALEIAAVACGRWIGAGLRERRGPDKVQADGATRG